MKQNWREILTKTDMHTSIVLFMFIRCCIFHNISLQKNDDVDKEILI
jgi:hypothetical protein